MSWKARNREAVTRVIGIEKAESFPWARERRKIRGFGFRVAEEIGFVSRSSRGTRKRKKFQYRQRPRGSCRCGRVHTDTVYIEVAFARSRVMVLRASRVI